MEKLFWHCTSKREVPTNINEVGARQARNEIDDKLELYLISWGTIKPTV